MFNLQVTSTTMELLPLVCLCLLTRSGTTFAEEGPDPERFVLKDRPGAAPKPYIRKFQTKDGTLLQCVVHGSPKPEVEWQDSAGNILPAGEPQVSERRGRYDIILKTNVTKTDRYRCVATQKDINHQIYTEIDVDLSGPKVIRVEEDSDVTLPCSLSSKVDIENNIFFWRKDVQKEVFLYEAGNHYNNGRAGQDQQFKGRVSHFPDKLKHGDASIKIRNMKVADSGDYTCDFPRLQPNQLFHIQLVVGDLTEGSGAAPKPYVTILDETKDGRLLQCEVLDASPKPEVEWQDRAGNILPAGEPQASETGGRYDIILNTTVTKTDLYRCVATQEDINHQIYTETFVYIPEPKFINVYIWSDVTLPCSLSTREDIESNRFDWKKDGQKEVFLYDAGNHYNNGRAGQDEQFEGRVSHFPDKLKHGDASIIIRKTKLADSGDYTCAFPRLQPRQIFHIRLVVGAAAKPSVTILDQTKDWSLLQCEVQGAPKPKVEWQDRAGERLPAEEPQVSERGGRYNIILQTIVTKTDRYRCVATQKDINHQIYAETYVFISGSGRGVAVNFSALLLLLVVVVLF